jgi:hypothetical protein
MLDFGDVRRDPLAARLVEVMIGDNRPGLAVGRAEGEPEYQSAVTS